MNITYHHFTLLLLATLGTFIHNLIQLNKINKSSNGNASLTVYWKLERFALILSFTINVMAVMISQEIKQLEQIGNWLGAGFVAIGYMGQSIVISFMGKAADKFSIQPDNEHKETPSNPNPTP